MENTCSTLVDIFGGFTFQRYELLEEATGLVRCCHVIDGSEVSQENWHHLKQIARDRDLKNLGLT